MAQGTLRFDSDGLHSLWSELRAVKSEFDHAEQRSGTAADAVGHAGLAARIRSFSSEWDGMRDQLSEAIGDLGDTALAIDDAFDQAERKLVESVAGHR